MAEEVIKLTYDPFALPTAQHRAGLAGLLVLVESMRRRKIKILPEISVRSDGTVTVALTRKSLTSTFNDLYDAATEEGDRSVRGKEKKRTSNRCARKKELTRRQVKKERYLYTLRLFPRRRFLPVLVCLRFGSNFGERQFGKH